MSDPADHAAALADLPRDVGHLNRIIQGLLVHCDLLPTYGLDAGRGAVDRTTLPVADRLDEIAARDPRPLWLQRTPDMRSIGTCRDFALLLCGILRGQGVPARLRCGFAAYLGPAWEDHWVCEYWDRGAWHRSDAQVDDTLRRLYPIAFDPTDLPPGVFVTAGQAWSEIRAGRSDLSRFGHGETTGAWFVAINVIRDHHAVNGREVSAWDGWRAAPPARRVVSDRYAAWIDGLASRPEQDLVEVDPDWLG